MENKLKKLFDYQRFGKNERMEKLISQTEERFGKELSDEELSRVNAAGEIPGITGDFTGNYAESEAPSGFKGFNNSNVWGEGQSGEIILPTDKNRKGE